MNVRTCDLLNFAHSVATHCVGGRCILVALVLVRVEYPFRVLPGRSILSNTVKVPSLHFHDGVEAEVDTPAGNSTSHTITHQQYIHIYIKTSPYESRCRKENADHQGGSGHFIFSTDAQTNKCGVKASRANASNA